MAPHDPRVSGPRAPRPPVGSARRRRAVAASDPSARCLPPNRTRTGAAVLVRQPASDVPDRAGVALPPNAPPLASGGRRLAAGHAPRRVGLQVAGLDPRRTQRAAHPRRGSSIGHRQGGGGPPALHLAGCRGASVSVSPTTHSPADRTHRDQGVERSGIVGEATPSPRHSAPTTCGACPSNVARRAASPPDRRRPRSRRCPARPPRRPPPGSSASPCTGRGGRGAPGRLRPRSAGHARSRPGQTQDDPRRAEPALAGPRGLNVSAHRPASSSPSTLVTCPSGHPPGRRHAGHPGLAVDQDGAAAALPLRAAAVLGGPDAQGGPEGPRAASSRRRAPRRAVHRPRR